jgi:hypothetical protein
MKKRRKKKTVGSMIIMLSSSAGVWGVFVQKVQEQIYSLVL